MKLYEYTKWPSQDVELIEYGIDDEPMFDQGFDEIQPDWTILDIGASIGYYTILAANKASKGVVVAVEPHPQIVEVLQRNVELHQLKNVRVVKCALSGPNSGEKVSMTEGGGRGGSEIIQQRAPWPVRLMRSIKDGSIVNKVARRIKPGPAPQKFEAKAQTLDDLIESLRLQRVDLLKMDIQGAEYEVLLGATKTLKDFRPILLVELHDRDNWSPETLQETVTGYGYKIRKDGAGHTTAIRADPVAR